MVNENSRQGEISIKPIHVAIIPDGNRRWASGKGLVPWEGHRAGARVADKLFDWCFIKHDIPIVSLYALSTENLTNRSKEELEPLWQIYEEYFRKIAEDERVHTHHIKIDVLGDKASLPHYLESTIDNVMEKTKAYSEHLLNFLMPYGGRYEIVEATRCIVRDIREKKLGIGDLNQEIFAQYLFTRDMPDPDLVIRTAEKRMSNFLLWQTVYSKVYFVDKYWPDFNLQDLEAILRDYSARKRRFGK